MGIVYWPSQLPRPVWGWRGRRLRYAKVLASSSAGTAPFPMDGSKRHAMDNGKIPLLTIRRAQGKQAEAEGRQKGTSELLEEEAFPGSYRSRGKWNGERHTGMALPPTGDRVTKNA